MTWPARCGVTAVVAASLILFMLILPLGAAGFVTEAFAGGAVIYFYCRRKPREWAATALVAAGLGAIYKLSGVRVERWIGWEVMFPAALFCFAALIVLFFRSTGETGAARQATLALIRAMALIPAVCLCSIVAVAFDIRVTPRTYDRFLFAFDRSLGFDPSYAMGRIFWRHFSVDYVAGLVYSSLPVNLCLLCALQMKGRKPGEADVRWAFVALGVVGFALYQICPATGPIYALGRASFPYHPPAAGALAIVPALVPDAPRNAMPSLHVAWCLLVLYNSWPHSLALKLYSLVCLLLTAAATIGLGEHYLIDLIVALPLSVAVQLACLQPKRRAAPAWCFAIVLAWLVALRTGAALRYGQPAVSWMLVCATLLAGAVIAFRAPRDSNREDTRIPAGRAAV